MGRNVGSGQIIGVHLAIWKNILISLFLLVMVSEHLWLSMTFISKDVCYYHTLDQKLNWTSTFISPSSLSLMRMMISYGVLVLVHRYQLSPQDKFTTRSNHQQRVPWRSVFWPSRVIPRHNFLTWLVTLNRCPTKDRMLNWGIKTDPTCVLCNGTAESRDHLFFLVLLLVELVVAFSGKGELDYF